MTKPYRSHDEAVSESLRADPAFAAEYLNAVIEDGDQAELLVALRQLAEALYLAAAHGEDQNVIADLRELRDEAAQEARK